MLKQNSRFLCWLPGLLLLLIPLTAGCDTSIGGTIGPPRPAGSPKGPGAANLTATALTTPALTSCGVVRVTPASTNGWSIYKDKQFLFQFAVPPGWRAGSFVDNGGDYIVQVFPPGSTTPFGDAGLIDPEHISVSIAPAGSTSTYANDTNWKAETGTITIGGVKTILYDRTSPGCGEVNRGATDDFRQHHFTFFLVTNPGKAQNDIALFLGMAESFVYSGST